MISTACRCGHAEDIPPIRAHLTDLVTGWTLTWTCHQCDAVNTLHIPGHDVADYATAGVETLNAPGLKFDARTDHLPEFTEEEYLELARGLHGVDYLAPLAYRRLLGAGTTHQPRTENTDA